LEIFDDFRALWFGENEYLGIANPSCQPDPFARSPQSIKASNPDLALRAGCSNACG